MAPQIIFRCSGCKARIKAPVQLLGRSCPCPGCGTRLDIRLQAPEDAAPLLVNEEQPSTRETPRR
jgi:hypothetical protein